MITCSVPGCDRKHKGRGLCDLHIQRQRRTGTTDSPVKTQEQRFWEKVDVRDTDECWPWTGALGSTGYGVLRPAGQRSGPCVKAHRYSAELAGMDIEGRFVLHACDNPPCVNPAHLRPGSHVENVRDMVDRDRVARGSARGQGVLTEAEIPVIHHLRSQGLTYKQIAARLGTGVHHGTIGAVCRGTSWAHVGGAA